MKINSLLTPNITFIKQAKKENNNSALQINNSISELPMLYGSFNIAFCGKITHKKVKKGKDILPEPDRHLPILENYSPAIFSVVEEIASGKPGIIIYNDIMDSKDIFLESLRTAIDTDNLKEVGLPRDIPFVKINLSDYVENYSSAVEILSKQLGISSKSRQRCIFIIENCRNFLNRLERPYDFIKSSLFEKHPSIFLIESGYNFMGKDEIENFELGLTSKENRGNNNYLDEIGFEKTKSKLKLLHGYGPDIVYLPSADVENAYIYLSKPAVQQELLGKGREISIDKKALVLALNLGRAFAFNKGDVYNLLNSANLLDGQTAAMEETIKLLQRAVIFSLIKNPHQKNVGVKEVIGSIPSDLPWQSIMNSYVNALKEANTETPFDINKQEECADEKVKESEQEKEDKQETGNTVKTRFSDIGGMYNIKKQLKEDFLDIIKNPNLSNAQKPSGILLAGPPGCGKTLLAKAIAGEAQVPFLSIAGSSFIEIYVGTGPKRVRDLYNKARELAKNHSSKTAIVFIDEVDAVAGSRRMGGGNSEDTKTVNALLHEMDGAASKDSDVKIITIVATNYEDMLDEAFKRSGRIDLKYNIEDPRYSKKAREEIIKIHSKDLIFKNEEEKLRLQSLLAQSTAGMSGADLAELMKKANRMSMRVGRNENYITEKDIAEAKMQVLSGIKTDIEHTEYELRQTVARSAGYALNAMFMEKVFEGESNMHKKPSRILDFITNSARGKSLGAAYFKPSNENKTKSKETCLSDVIMLYGGYATESYLFDTHSSMIDDDLRKATEIIEEAVSQSDFGSQKHYLSLTSNLTKSLFAQEIKDDMIAFSKKGMEISKSIISFTAPFIEEYINDVISSGEFDSTVTSQEFQEKFQQWLIKSNKQEEYKELLANIKKSITEFCGEKERNRMRLGFNNN